MVVGLDPACVASPPQFLVLRGIRHYPPLYQQCKLYRRTRIGQRVDGNQAAGLTANA